MSAPFKTQTASAANDPASLFDGLSFFKIFPMNDLFDTDMRSGVFNLIDLKFSKINKSLLTQSELIFVKKEFLPFFLKNPMAGSKTILDLAIFADFAISKLFFNNCFVSRSWLPVMIFLLYAHKISDGQYLSIIFGIIVSYFSPVTSLIISTPNSKTSFATAALHVSTEMGKFVVR